MRIRFVHPQQKEIHVVNLPNFEYLALFYLFPKELLESECPSLVDMPRTVHGIFTQEKWFTKLASDFFLQTVCDLTGFLCLASFWYIDIHGVLFWKRSALAACSRDSYLAKGI